MVEVQNLTKYFHIKRGVFKREVGFVKAVDGVSFDIPRGKTLGLVGESGSGKTTVGKLLAGLLRPDRGQIVVDSKNLYRRRRLDTSVVSGVQLIFQDPISSLDPKMKVRDIILEGLYVRGADRGFCHSRLKGLLDMVGLPKDSPDRYPHQFSGGQRQRIAIARAISTNPKFIVCDEPVSNLDVSIQAQVLNLLKDLQEELALTYLFISHDLTVVEYMSDEVAVMHNGRIVEAGPKESIYKLPRHPYTERLVDSILQPALNQ